MTFYEQIQQAIDYIEDNLFNDLSSKAAAQKAFMSESNFYRYFSALTGFTFKEYIRKRRLCSTLKNLNNPKHRILDIAVLNRFESHEAFTRAFKKEFGLTPSEYRSGRHHVIGINRKILIKEYFMGIAIKEMDSMKVAYYRVISKAPEYDVWHHIYNWGNKAGILKNSYRIFGFNNPSPDDMQKLKDAQGNEYFANISHSEYGYEGMVTVGNDDIARENGGCGVDFKTFKGGRFAVMSIGAGCEIHDIEKGWAKFGSLLKQGDFKTTGRWFEEHLDFDLAKEDQSFRMDLYVEIE